MSLARTTIIVLTITICTGIFWFLAYQSDPVVPQPIVSQETSSEAVSDEERWPDRIMLKGTVVDGDGNLLDVAGIEFRWLGATSIAPSFSTGEWERRVDPNDGSESEIILTRRLNIQDRIANVRFEGTLNGDKFKGVLKTRIGNFAVSAKCAAECDGLIGTWNTNVQVEGELFPGTFAIALENKIFPTGTWSDELGNAVVTLEKLPGDCELKASSKSKLRIFSTRIMRPKEPQSGITLRLLEPSTVAAALVNAEGNPAANWNILIAGSVHAIEIKTDAQGKATTDPFTPGTYNLYIFPDNPAQGKTFQKSVTLKPGTTALNLTIE